MKQSITLLLSVLLIFTGLKAQVILEENFNADLGGWVESGGGGLGWFSGIDIDFWGGSSSIDGTNMAFIDDDANGYGSPAFISTLTSPVLDLSPFTVVNLEFDYNFFVSCGTETFTIEAFDGSSWTQIFFLNSSDCGFWGCDFATGSYPHADISLTPYINPAFQLRMSYDDAGCWGFWIAVDNMLIFQPPPADVGVSEILSPLTGCSLSAAEVLNVSVSNTGTLPQSGFDMFFSVDGLISGPEVFTGTINPGETLPFAFATPADLSGAGFHEIFAWTSLAGDGFPSNDSSSTSVESFASVSAPYLETFDGGFFTPSGWFNDFLDGGFEDWYFNSGPLFVFGTGPDADHTSGFGIYSYVSDFGDQEGVELSSPCVDVSGLFSPYLSFWYHSHDANEGFFPDFVNELHIDIQSGGTWFLDVIPPIGTELFEWQEKEISLAGYGPNLRVRFRANTQNGWFEHFIAIDDFRIFDKAPVDVGVVEITSPVSACGLSTTETISVDVKNLGTLDQSGFDVNYRVDGGAVVSQPFPGTLVAGVTFPFTFTATADFSSPITHTIEAWTSLVGDLAPYNDSLSANVDNVPQVNTFPYQQDFESGSGGWTFVNQASSTWELGSPAGPVINTPPPSTPSSLNSWTTNLDDVYNNNEEGYILSPCFDFSSLLAPEIYLDIWWDCESFWDGSHIQFTLDNGLTWNAVGSFFTTTGENWYNNSFLIAMDWTGFQEGWSKDPATGLGSGGWVRAKEDMPALAGAPEVRFRISFGSDGSVTYDGVAFDNILIRDKPGADLAVVEVAAPINGCELSSAEPVTISIENAGTAPQSGFPVKYRINGGSVVTETYSATIPALTTVNYTFATPADLSVVGTYTLEAWTALATDEGTFNDSITVEVTHVPSIASFPYIEDFEVADHGWTSGGTGSSWELGLPAGSVIVGIPETGLNSWATSLTGNYNDNERSFIISPCFDFTTMSNPAVAFDIWWEAESGFFFGPTDGAVMQYSLDGGATWQRVGNFGEPINWYNYSSIGSAPGDEPFPAPGWSGNIGSGDGSFNWVRAQHNLDGLAGVAGVRLRIAFSADGFGNYDGYAIDNFGIQDAPAPVLGGDTAFCIGESVVLSPGIVGTEYLWSTGAGSPTITVAESGTYWVKVTDANGFSGSDTIVVEVIAEPIVDLGIDRDFCEGAELDAGNPGYEYLWSDGSTDQLLPVTTSGTYSVTVSVPEYGCPVSDNVTLNIIFKPTAAFLWTSTGTTAYFFDASPLSTAWSWNFGDGATAEVRDPEHEYAAPGVYEVTLIASNECGSTELTLQITVVASGLDAPTLAEGLMLFPNPTSDWMQISGTQAPSDELAWMLYDASGRLALSGSESIAPGAWNFQIDLSGKAEGAYLLELRSGDESVMQRVFRQ